MKNGLIYNYSEPKKEKFILLIHGLGSSSEIWEKLTSHLKSEYTIIRLDLYGHKNNDFIPKEDVSVQKTADDIIHELKSKRLEKIDIIGHSLGGLIAIDTAIKQRDLVNRLILVDTPTKQTGLKFMRSFFLKLIKKDYETVIKGHYKKMTSCKNLYEELLDIALKTDKSAYYQYMKSLFESDYSLHFHKLNAAKVYLLFSQSLVPKEKSLNKILKKYGYNGICQENIYYFKDSGHYIMKEKEKEFTDLIEDIL